MNDWVTDKPDFKEECLVIAASKIGGSWDYSVFVIKKEYSEEGVYMAIFTGDMDEWGDIDDLSADKYFVMPLLT